MFHVKQADEIAELRRIEEQISRESERLGRLQNRLMRAHPGNLVVTGSLSAGTWAALSAGWQTASELRLTPWRGIPPADVSGTARQCNWCLHLWAEGGWPGRQKTVIRARGRKELRLSPGI